MKVSPIEDNENSVTSEMKQLLKRAGIKIAKKLVIITLPIVIVLLVLSAITWFVFRDEGTWNDNESGNPSTYTKNVILSPTAGISTDKMELVKRCLSDMGYTDEKISTMTEAEIIEILQMKMKLNKNVTSIESCTIAEILWCVNNDYIKYLKTPEDLEILLNAELITQYPKIDGLPADKLNGIIQFARVDKDDDSDADGDIDIDDNSQMLTYIDSTEFDTKFNNYISSGNKDVFNYFTLDDQQNVVIATWSEESGSFESNNTTSQTQQKIKPGHTQESIQSEYDSRYAVTGESADSITASYVTYTATKQTINYKANVQKYTLCFDYLWSLLVMGQSDKFILELAQLAYESQIVVGIYDSVSERVNVETYVYTENFRERYEEYHDGYCVISTEWTNPPEAYDYYDINTTTSLNNTVQYDIMYANTWIVEVIARYKNVHTSENYNPEAVSEADEEWSDNGSYTNSWVDEDTDTYTDPETGEETTTTTYTDIDEVYFKEKRTIGKSYTVQQTTNYNSFEKVETEIKEKTDIDPNTDNNFVKILRADTNASTMLFKPINVVWLTNMLKENADTANMVELTKFLINKAKNPDDTSLMFDFSIFGENSFTSISGGSNISPFGVTMSKEEFINAASAYRVSNDYKNYIVPYLEDFYDICTEYNINPVLALAHACIETGYGSSSSCKNNKNYFGYAHYNNSTSGKVYSSVAESIEDFCKWIIENAYIGTSAYSSNIARATEYATENPKLKGTPDKNIYVLYCRYAYLGDTHICDEPDFSNPAGTSYYIANGSNWGTGGRIYTYTMYEAGGLYSGEYATRCGHSNGTDETTTAERADYIVYVTNQRVDVAETIFGKGCLRGNAGSILEAAYEVADYFNNCGVDVHYAGNSVKGATNNGRICVWNNIQNSWDKPVKLPNSYGVVCATYVSFALWQAGIVDEATINKYNYNSCLGLQEMFTKSYSQEFQKITNYSELQEGDIVFQPGHVLIYVGDGKGIDQNYCVVKSSGKDDRNKLVNVRSSKFDCAYRYVGK